MLTLTQAVGPSGGQPHDTALVQYWLGLTLDASRKPYWTGGIDGRMAPALAAAVTRFQEEHIRSGIPMKGQVQLHGPTIGALERALPREAREVPPSSPCGPGPRTSRLFSWLGAKQCARSILCRWPCGGSPRTC